MGRNLFSVNLQTGTILFNGLPPSRLPASILKLPLYKRTFADRNFEVVTDETGALRTTRPISGRVYSFFVNANGALIVHEREDREGGSDILELLDGTPEQAELWGALMGASLPIRLRHMHSHWLSRDRCVILLRPHSFDRRRVEFLLVWNPEEQMILNTFLNPSFSCRCYRIPEHLQKKSWQEELIPLAATEKLDELMAHPNPPDLIIQILRKFETDAALIHTYRACNGDLLFELPRYGLVFQLDIEDVGSHGNQLESRNFLGFSLSAQQQLDDALFGFSQYLVLESGQRKRMYALREPCLFANPSLLQLDHPPSSQYSSPRNCQAKHWGRT